jgi:hypothetical protein
MQFLLLFASEQSSNIESGVVSTGLKIILTGIFSELSRASVIAFESAAT